MWGSGGGMGKWEGAPLWLCPVLHEHLYNWKAQNPQFSEKPQAFIGLLETVFHTHQLTWDDCQQLLLPSLPQRNETSFV